MGPVWFPAAGAGQSPASKAAYKPAGADDALRAKYTQVAQQRSSGAGSLATDEKTRTALEGLRRSPTAKMMIDRLGKEHSGDLQVTLQDKGIGGSAGATQELANGKTQITVSEQGAKCEQYHDEQGRLFSRAPEAIMAHELGHAYINRYGDTEHLREEYQRSHPGAAPISNHDLAILYENKIARELDPKAPTRQPSHDERCTPSKCETEDAKKFREMFCPAK